MSVTAIPKRQLVELIMDLKAEARAAAYFNIQSQTPIKKRLQEFPKERLLRFIPQIGPGATARLGELATAFPFRRPLTLYISIIASQPNSPQRLSLISNALAKRGRDGELRFPHSVSVPFVYLPQPGRKMTISDLPVYEVELQYGFRMEYGESNPEADDYGQSKDLYSLESAFVWIPLQKYEHAIIACSDYPAVGRIRDFLSNQFDIRLSPPWLDQEILEKITHGALPRTVTYSLRAPDDTVGEVQSITISDPMLPQKKMFQDMATTTQREQTAGFYTGHRGLPAGGIGVARRDGKIWTPSCLDLRTTLALSLTLIEQTETELSKIKGVQNLIEYFYGVQANVAGKELSQPVRDAWKQLLWHVMEAQRTKTHEVYVEPELLDMLIHFKQQLCLLAAIEYDCPHCGVRWLAKCPLCEALLVPAYHNGFVATCPKGHKSMLNLRVCQECQGELPATDPLAQIRILPDVECSRSIDRAARQLHRDYSGSWCIQGFALKHLSPVPLPSHPVLRLEDFDLWKRRAKITSKKKSMFSADKTDAILNCTHEKCSREGKTSSEDKCSVCLKNALDPKWIERGDTCLLRLFGIPIGLKFNGVHHGHEVADLRYEDTLLSTHSKVKVAIHVKSRRPKQPPNGMGRSSVPIKGLYTQTVYSAFQARERGEPIDVIGIAMPNTISKEVIDSLAYAVNALGFPFVVVQEDDWRFIINEAFVQNLFNLEDHQASAVDI